MGIDQRIAHAGLGGEIDHPLRLFALEKLGNPSAIGNIEPRQRETRVGRQTRESCLLEGDVVVVVEIVYPDDFVAAREQALADMHADKTRGAGEQDFHWRFL